MAANKKPRKKYSATQKTWHSKSSVLFRYTPEQETMLQVRPQMSLEQFVTNVGTEPAFRTLEFRVYVGRALIEYFETGQATDELDDAIELLKVAEKLCFETGKWVLSADDIAALRVALNIVDTLQLNCTRKQMLFAYNDVYKKLTIKNKETT